MLWLTLVLALGVGLSLGLLGGGGSILTVPLLTFVAGMPPREAIASSLLVVGVTSLVAAGDHARAGRVRWRTGVLFGLASMLGAYAGGRLAAHVPDRVLLIGFAVLMLVTAVAMIRGRRGSVTRPERAASDLPIARAAAYGIGIGLLTGLVGAGGGFLVVPALVLLGGLAMPVAVGTSLLVIALNCVAGFVGHLASATISWGTTAAVTGVAVVGALLGGRSVAAVPAAGLRTAFGWFVLVMGVLVLMVSALGR